MSSTSRAMLSLRCILCPIDFSEHSRQALRWAEALAARYQSRLIVLNAVDPLLAAAAKSRLGLDLANTETEPSLREFVSATWPGDATRSLRLTFDVRVGDPSDVILEAAARETADLIVMGTQGLGGIRKWFLGSTTERVLRRAHTPVFAVPFIVNEPAAPDASTAGFALGRILLATDFSDASAAALQWAAQIAGDFSVPLLLTHAVEAVTVPTQWKSYADESQDARLADARARLARVASQFSESQLPQTVVSIGRPADAIALIAEEWLAGLIVMGLTGTGGPFAPRPGSIAYRVLSLAKVPVVVPQPPPLQT